MRFLWITTAVGVKKGLLWKGKELKCRKGKRGSVCATKKGCRYEKGRGSVWERKGVGVRMEGGQCEKGRGSVWERKGSVWETKGVDVSTEGVWCKQGRGSLWEKTGVGARKEGGRCKKRRGRYEKGNVGLSEFNNYISTVLYNSV
jgi:hypothetical protein